MWNYFSTFSNKASSRSSSSTFPSASPRVSSKTSTLQPRDCILEGVGVIQLANVRIIRNGRLIKEDLWFSEGQIIDPEERFWTASKGHEFSADCVVDCSNLIAAPGFISSPFSLFSSVIIRSSFASLSLRLY
jgi:hypothetical protein